jgi:hypothetical protein
MITGSVVDLGIPAQADTTSLLGLRLGLSVGAYDQELVPPLRRTRRS